MNSVTKLGPPKITLNLILDYQEQKETSNRPVILVWMGIRRIAQEKVGGVVILRRQTNPRRPWGRRWVRIKKWVMKSSSTTTTIMMMMMITKTRVVVIMVWIRFRFRGYWWERGEKVGSSSSSRTSGVVVGLGRKIWRWVCVISSDWWDVRCLLWYFWV